MKVPHGIDSHSDSIHMMIGLVFLTAVQHFKVSFAQ